MKRPITLLTDFGPRDWYVGVMKGVILNNFPNANIIDISHEIMPHDIMEAANLLKEVIPFYPPGSIHVCVVDPGVGSERNPIAIQAENFTLIGPDNGIFSLALSQETGPHEIFVLDQTDHWRTPLPDRTFHGRDIFAPIAAKLAKGIPIDAMGSKTDQLNELRWVQPILDKGGIQGWVVHVDHFGNCITNISRDNFNDYTSSSELGKANVKAYLGSAIVEGVSSTYSDVAKGEVTMLFGSSNFLEISVNGDKAGSLFSIKRGDQVSLIFS